MHSLLVPLDGSEFSERAVPLALTLGRETGATLHLTHVHVPHPPDQLLSNTQFHYEGLDMAEYEARNRQKEAAYLEGVATRLRNGVRVKTHLLEGRVADEITAYADRVDADLIVMTTHGHTGVSRMWLGSVADTLVRHTTLPLLVIHPPPHEHLPPEVHNFAHILVPLDGSETSESILDPACDLAVATSARLTLLHIVSSTTTLGARLFPLLPDDIASSMEQAEEYLKGVADRLHMPHLDVDIHVEEHEAPARAIVEIAQRERADIVAMATHGYGGVRRVLLGSVADKVLRSSPLPLLVRRPA